MATNSFFPSRIITIYMAKMFLVRTFAVLFALVLVLQTLDLLGSSGDVLAYKGNDGGDILTYISLRAPQIISLFLPFSVLLGTVVTLATLNQNSEVVSMKGAGLSAHQVLAHLHLMTVSSRPQQQRSRAGKRPIMARSRKIRKCKPMSGFVREAS
jgi:lipopolysaccharide export system permease protein